MAIAEHVATSSSTMIYATVVPENMHMVLRRSLDALQLKIKNCRAFNSMGPIGVQAAADILTHDIMPIAGMARPPAWPVLCAALAEWMVQFSRENVSRCASYVEGILESNQMPNPMGQAPQKSDALARIFTGHDWA